MSSLAHRLILADSGWDCGFHCNIFLMNHAPFLFASDIIKWNVFLFCYYQHCGIVDEN